MPKPGERPELDTLTSWSVGGGGGEPGRWKVKVTMEVSLVGCGGGRGMSPKGHLEGTECIPNAGLLSLNLPAVRRGNGTDWKGMLGKRIETFQVPLTISLNQVPLNVKV